jgi:adenine-specific DNA-methyltransferase
VRNFGNKLTWDRSFEEYLLKFAKEANSLIFDSGKLCYSLNHSALNLDSYGYDLVYLDPPYLKRNDSNESSNYLRCYHFLEGLARYQEWDGFIDFSSINHRFRMTIDDDDFRRASIYETYEILINNYKKSTIVLSYKMGGIPSISFLINLIKKVKGNVHTYSKHYQYALNHQNGDAKKNREVLIIGI